MFGVQEPEPGASRAHQAQHCQMPALPEHWSHLCSQQGSIARCASLKPATPQQRHCCICLSILLQEFVPRVQPKSVPGAECPRCALPGLSPASQPQQRLNTT